MKAFLYIFLLLFFHRAKAQELNTIYANEKQAVALFFPNTIRQAIAGAKHFTFSYNKENPQYVGLLQGVYGNKSNLLVITNDGQIYSYLLRYRRNLSKLNYFIQSKEGIGNEKPFNVSGLKDSLPELADIPEIDLVKTVPKKPLEHFKKVSDYLLKRNRNSLKKKRKKGLILHLKDLFYDRTEVYALIEIKNRSGIDFEVDYLKIFKVNGNKKRKSSYQKLEMEAVYTQGFPTLIKKGQKVLFVVVLPKFTIGDSEKVLLESKELKGSRTIRLSSK